MHRATVGQQKLWQCLKVTEGRRKGARAWQDHFVDILLWTEVSGNLQAESEVPCSFLFERVREIALDLHVDDGYVTGLAENMKKVFAYLETNIVL